ncbi:Glycosyltransferases involved in cell wall biogenesis, partial [mine drainage metagenome]
MRAGFDAATGQWIAVVDADLELPIELLHEFFQIQKQTGADVVVGSKRHPESV